MTLWTFRLIKSAFHLLVLAIMTFAATALASAATNNEGMQLVPAIIKNKTGNDAQLYVAIVGQANIGSSDQNFYSATGSNGDVKFYTSGGTAVIGYGVNLGKNGKARIQVPQLQSGRIYFSFHNPLAVTVASKGIYYSIGGPSGWTTSDPNYSTPFDWLEYNWAPGSGSQTLGINTTQVDMFGIPIKLTLFPGTGKKQTVGAKRNAWKNVFNALESAGSPWTDLIVQPHGLPDLRVIAPGHAINTAPFNFPDDQLEDYISSVYKLYKKKNKNITIEINSQEYTGSSNGNTLTFTPGSLTISEPTTLDVYNNTIPASDPSNPIVPFVAASLLRSTLLKDATPSDCNTKTYYKSKPVDVYAKTFHQHAIGGKAYGMPYDDTCDQSSYITADPPRLMKIILQPMAQDN